MRYTREELIDALRAMDLLDTQDPVVAKVEVVCGKTPPLTVHTLYIRDFRVIPDPRRTGWPCLSIQVNGRDLGLE